MVHGGQTGNCYCIIFGCCSHSFYAPLANPPSAIRLFQRLTLSGELNQVRLKLSKVGTPNRAVYFRIRKTSDDSILTQETFHTSSFSNEDLKTFTFPGLELNAEEIDIGCEIDTAAGLGWADDLGICNSYEAVEGAGMFKYEVSGNFSPIWGDMCMEWWYDDLATGVKKLKTPFSKIMKEKVGFRKY